MGSLEAILLVICRTIALFLWAAIRSGPRSRREGFIIAMAFAIGLSLAAPLNFLLS
jgi:hypothetical protein